MPRPELVRPLVRIRWCVGPHDYGRFLRRMKSSGTSKNPLSPVDIRRCDDQRYLSLARGTCHQGVSLRSMAASSSGEVVETLLNGGVVVTVVPKGTCWTAR